MPDSPAPIPSVLASRPLAADLLSLRELQASLALEENDVAVVRVGTNAIVEILAIDCGLALVDGEGGRPPIRFGWLQGRAMALAEMESLAAALDREIAAARDGGVGTRLLTIEPITSPGAPLLPPEARALGFGAALILGLGNGGQRTGTLVLAARDREAFSGEQAILAEILAAQMAEQCGRVRVASRTILAAAERPAPAAAGKPGQESPANGGSANGDVARLQARVKALEAQAAVASAVSLSHDAARQIATVLRKAIDLTGHVAGAIYLVETNDACEDILAFAHGEGDPAWLEVARLPRWRQGEGLPGRVWASGEGLAFGTLDDDPAGVGPDVLRRARYRRMCCEPLKARGRTVGVLELMGDRAGAYGDEERAHVRAIGHQVGMAIHNARLVADLMRHGLDLEWQVERHGSESRRAIEGRLALEGAMAAAAAEPDAESRAAAVLGRLLEMTGGDMACVHEIDPVTGRFNLLAQRRVPSEALQALYRLPAEDPTLSRVPSGGGVAVLDLAAPDLVASGWPPLIGVRHVALVPCRSGKETRGVLMLGSRYAGAFSEGVRDAFTVLASLLGLAIECGLAGRREREKSPDTASRESATGGVKAAGGVKITGGRNTAPFPAVGMGEDEIPNAAVAETTAPFALAGTRPGHAGAAPAASPGVLVQAQKTASIGRLVPGFERDFNSTIGAIMGHASHIRALVPDHNPVHDKAAVIEEQSYRVADLVRRLLTFSRGGIGRREPLDINVLVEETVALLSRTLDPTIVLEARCGSGLPQVEVDAGEMRQALLNLAVNARDALPDGGRVIFETRAGHLDAGAVASLQGLAPGDYVALVISDNGIGMEPEVLERAFEPFFTTKPITQGSGLGLTVAHDIIRDHGGHIALSSAPGIGTAARLYLPVAGGRKGVETPTHGAPLPGTAVAWNPEGPGAMGTAFAAADPAEGAATGPTGEPMAMPPFEAFEDVAPHEAAAEDATVRSRTAPDAAPGDTGMTAPRTGVKTPPWLKTCPLTEQAKGRILVVDDEAVLRDMMAEMLRSRGYEVVTAKDGVEALEIYRQEWGKIDLVVCDLIMPRLGGLETFRRIVGMNRSARVLLCSGSTHHRQAQQALAEGALGLLPKPFGMSELAGWIERGLQA